MDSDEREREDKRDQSRKEKNDDNEITFVSLSLSFPFLSISQFLCSIINGSPLLHTILKSDVVDVKDSSQ